MFPDHNRHYTEYSTYTIMLYFVIKYNCYHKKYILYFLDNLLFVCLPTFYSKQYESLTCALDIKLKVIFKISIFKIVTHK